MVFIFGCILGTILRHWEISDREGAKSLIEGS